MHTVAVASVAIAVILGIIAWETHEERVFTKNIYCSNFFSGPEPDPQQEEMFERLGC